MLDSYSYALDVGSVAKKTTDYVFALFHLTFPVQHRVGFLRFNTAVEVSYIWINPIWQLILSALLSYNLIQTFADLKFVLNDKGPQNPTKRTWDPESPEIIKVDLNLVMGCAVDSRVSCLSWAQTPGTQDVLWSFL